MFEQQVTVNGKYAKGSIKKLESTGQYGFMGKIASERGNAVLTRKEMDVLIQECVQIHEKIRDLEEAEEIPKKPVSGDSVGIQLVNAERFTADEKQRIKERIQDAVEREQFFGKSGNKS